MLTTAISILAAVALLSPGFVIVELSEARRARARRSDLELTLRALVYSVLVHLMFCWWTAWLAREVGDVGAAGDHLPAVVAYVLAVLVVGPAAIGVLIGAYLSRAERSPGPPGFLAAAFGAGRATDAFDSAFQHHEGAWVIVELVGGSPGARATRAASSGAVRPSGRRLRRMTSTWRTSRGSGPTRPEIRTSCR